ncbi:MAG TPA: FAD-dependent oxidoreductase [Saprospiraceae bacterium]|nr:FAD-dependent oxidoreductase [Saprospiraceae bacterium]HPI08187.1 FAD-dependent oxidoreductase [Saprospiraceae bacterium]
MDTQQFDFVVIGGGIFGCYAALYLAKKGAKIALLEKESRLFRKASLVNQARLHSGYHYPRSLATAALSDEHKERFTAEHRRFVHFSFEKYYAIDRFGSFTDPLQFERFCTRLNIPFERVSEHKLFNFNRLEALYLTEEYSFDPVLLSNYYREKVENEPGIQVIKDVRLQSATADGDRWFIEFDRTSTPLQGIQQISTPTVINATYAASNAINQLFEAGNLALTHELSEIAFVTSREFGDRGLTVMDGPFGSIMPYGCSGLLSLSSVAYTHHKISYEDMPQFDCQIPEDPSCRPQAPGICTDCPRRPESNAAKMLAQMRQYFSDSVNFEHLFSYYTIKSKLKSSYIDDGRPTEISLLRESPRFYCLFSGKINSIYEVEKIV